MEQERFYIQLPPEVSGALDDSELFRRAVADELAKQGFKSETEWTRNPLSLDDDKDLVLVILAVGAAGVMIGSAVKMVIDAMNRGNPPVTVETTRRVALDRYGHVVRDRSGNPVFETEEKPNVYNLGEGTDSTELKWGNLLEFRSSSGPKPEHGKST